MENSKKNLHRYKFLLSAVGRWHIGGVSKCTPSFLCTDKSARVGGYSPLAASHPPLDAFHK